MKLPTPTIGTPDSAPHASRDSIPYAPTAAAPAPDSLAAIRHENLDDKVYARIRAMIGDEIGRASCRERV